MPEASFSWSPFPAQEPAGGSLSPPIDWSPLFSLPFEPFSHILLCLPGLSATSQDFLPRRSTPIGKILYLALLLTTASSKQNTITGAYSVTGT